MICPFSFLNHIFLSESPRRLVVLRTSKAAGVIIPLLLIQSSLSFQFPLNRSLPNPCRSLILTWLHHLTHFTVHFYTTSPLRDSVRSVFLHPSLLTLWAPGSFLYYTFSDLFFIFYFFIL